VVRVNRQVAEEIYNYVSECNVMRLTAKQTVQYLATRGHNISDRTVKVYKAKIRADATKWIAALARSKNSDYLAEYHERIKEIKAYQKELWIIYDSPNTRPHVKADCMGKLTDCTMKLTDLYDRLPIVTAMKDYKDNNQIDVDNTKQQQEELTN
jgi:hypothetical protein